MVGGSNAHFTGNFWRLRPIDFNEASALGGVPGTGLADWPITYEELEPYYSKAEWELGVSGVPGPFDPPRSRPYPDAAPSREVVRACSSKRARLPSAIIRSRRRSPSTPCRTTGGRRASTAASACSSCASSARSPPSMATMLPVAEATGRCEIRPESYVARSRPIGTDARPVSRTSTREKRLHLQRANAVVLCANGAETPRLLLNSESSRFPQGLANSSGVVGKYLMFNTYFGVHAQFEHPLNEFKSVQNTRMLLDFYDTDPKRGFYGGGGIDARFGQYPIMYALQGLPADAPTWGEGFARTLADQFTRIDVLRHARYVTAARDESHHDRTAD